MVACKRPACESDRGQINRYPHGPFFARPVADDLKPRNGRARADTNFIEIVTRASQDNRVAGADNCTRAKGSSVVEIVRSDISRSPDNGVEVTRRVSFSRARINATSNNPRLIQLAVKFNY